MIHSVALVQDRVMVLMVATVQPVVALVQQELVMVQASVKALVRQMVTLVVVHLLVAEALAALDLATQCLDKAPPSVAAVLPVVVDVQTLHNALVAFSRVDHSPSCMLPCLRSIGPITHWPFSLHHCFDPT